MLYDSDPKNGMWRDVFIYVLIIGPVFEHSLVKSAFESLDGTEKRGIRLGRGTWT